MYASFDRNSPTPLSADVLSLSWKGDAGQGWLACGNSRKIVGVTYTEMRDEEDGRFGELFSEREMQDFSLERQGMRRNFNFREHSQEVTIVRWNKHLDKIATCDNSGTVIVWRNHSGRSIMELVNNRGTPISDFQWSNDGSKVLIAYIDGYVLVGTAYGRRIWARQLNLGSFVTSPSNHSQSSRLLSSTWSPDDSRIVVGSSIGELIELDAVHGGTLVSTTEVLPGIGIIGLQWVLTPKTQHPGQTTTSHGARSPLAASQLDSTREAQSKGEKEDKTAKSSIRLSLYLRNGKVVLMNSCGDQQATIIRTGLVDGKMLWSSDGSTLAVAGFRKSQSMSTIRFFQPSGQLLFTMPLGTKEPVTAITWAHADQKLFVATTNLLHSVAVHRSIPTLQSLCQMATATALPSRDASFDLILPTKLKVAVAESFDSIVQGHVPEPGKLLSYVSRPPPSTHRIFCTVVPNVTPNQIASSVSASSSLSASLSASSSSSMSLPSTSQPSAAAHHRSSCRHPTSYTLYVEHLGSLVPVLEATKRSTKIRQSYSISLPNEAVASSVLPQPQKHVLDTSEGEMPVVASETSRSFNHYSHEAHSSLNTESGVQLACREDDTDSPSHPHNSASATPVEDNSQKCGNHPESSRLLAEVTSNVMASKFKIQGLSNKLPVDMGTVMIKTSFLHIQPRKVIAYLPQPDMTDSGIDTDSSSDEYTAEEYVVVELEPPIENLTSMEELQLLKSIELEPQTLRPIVETQALQLSHAHSQTQRSSVSVSESSIQIHSKTPTWNEQHMIYQLDFGGRVTTKSAKNFQLEIGGEQVLQFGRIDNGSFILDFQAPFTPIQAFATALANLV